ncbi:MAG: hypothetical protein WBG50_28665 [Desulfomonilaceae bacterium]
MKKEKDRVQVNDLITFQVDEFLNLRLRDAAWQDRKSLSALIRELCSNGLRQRSSEVQQASK